MHVNPLRNDFISTFKLILKVFFHGLEDWSCRNKFINRPSCHTIRFLHKSHYMTLFNAFLIAILHQRSGVQWYK